MFSYAVLVQVNSDLCFVVKLFKNLFRRMIMTAIKRVRKSRKVTHVVNVRKNDFEDKRVLTVETGCKTFGAMLLNDAFCYVGKCKKCANDIKEACSIKTNPKIKMGSGTTSRATNDFNPVVATLVAGGQIDKDSRFEKSVKQCYLALTGAGHGKVVVSYAQFLNDRKAGKKKIVEPVVRKNIKYFCDNIFAIINK